MCSALKEFADLLKSLKVAPPLPLFQQPTPLEPHENMSHDLGIRLLLKREDKVDDLGSGHKLRKLSYIVANAMASNCDVLVTAGSLPSNQCKAVAATALRLGLRAHLVFGGDRQRRPIVAQGNYLLTTMIPATVSWHEQSPWDSMNRHIEEAAERERQNGAHPYLIASGASDWPGLLGSVELGFEIAAQLEAKGIINCHLVAVAGSGGTCLGLALAARLLRKQWKVSGICIGAGAAAVASHTKTLLAEFERYSETSLDISDILDFTDIALGDGYDRPRKEELDAVAMVVQRYGLLFDSNYMIKAYLGLCSLLSAKKINSDTVLLVHSGGQIGFFDSNEVFVRWHRETRGNYLAASDT